MWSHILRDQLDVSESTFWDCVRNGVKPDRGGPTVPTDSLPAELVHLLITRLGLTDAEVAGMTRAEAIARLHRYWTEPR